MVLHLQQVDKLGHSAALFDDLLKVEVRIRDKLVYGLLVSKHAILVRLLMLEDTQVGLTGHQQALLDNVDETETEEVQWDVHEIRCGQRHQTKDIDLVTDDLGFNVLRDLLFLNPQTARLFGVEGTRFADQNLAQLVRHVLFVLAKDAEEVAS